MSDANNRMCTVSVYNCIYWCSVLNCYFHWQEILSLKHEYSVSLKLAAIVQTKVSYNRTVLTVLFPTFNIILLLLLLSVIEFPLCGINPYTTTDKTYKNEYN